MEAVKAGRSVYFTTLAELISTLARAEREGRLQDKIRFFCRWSLLVIDEPKDGAARSATCRCCRAAATFSSSWSTPAVSVAP